MELHAGEHRFPLVCARDTGGAAVAVAVAVGVGAAARQFPASHPTFLSASDEHPLSPINVALGTTRSVRCRPPPNNTSVRSARAATTKVVFIV
jgi:hypothetical protein